MGEITAIQLNSPENTRPTQQTTQAQITNEFRKQVEEKGDIKITEQDNSTSYIIRGAIKFEHPQDRSTAQAQRDYAAATVFAQLTTSISDFDKKCKDKTITEVLITITRVDHDDYDITIKISGKDAQNMYAEKMSGKIHASKEEMESGKFNKLDDKINGMIAEKGGSLNNNSDTKTIEAGDNSKTLSLDQWIMRGLGINEVLASLDRSRDAVVSMIEKGFETDAELDKESDKKLGDLRYENKRLANADQTKKDQKLAQNKADDIKVFASRARKSGDLERSQELQDSVKEA